MFISFALLIPKTFYLRKKSLEHLKKLIQLLSLLKMKINCIQI